MIKEIQYKGFTEAPSDYECPDGDLATIEGLVTEDEALRPILTPTDMFTLPNGYNVVFIHKNTGYKHYIIRNGKKIYWIDEPQQGAVLSISDFIDTGDNKNLLRNFDTADIYGINAIGNTLVILASDGMHYILWKGATDKYKYLGTHIPELPISFGLQGELAVSDEFRFGFTAIYDTHSGGTVEYDAPGWYEDFSDGNKDIFTRNVLAKVNKLIAEKTSEGKFIYPFLVRYAYRLYDQTLTMHSAPVLMVCSSDCAPRCLVNHVYLNGDDYDFNEVGVKLACMVHQLDYRVISQTDLNDLKEWSDIVQSVDVFVSAPIYTYDQSGECKRFMDNKDYDGHPGDYGYSLCKLILSNGQNTTLDDYYQRATFNDLYEAATGGSIPVKSVQLPSFDASTVSGKIQETANFYLIRSFDLNELSTSRTIVDYPATLLQSLTSRERMGDDYDSHNLLTPKRSFVYNGRLNIANINSTIFNGYYTGSMFCFSDAASSNLFLVRVCVRNENKEMVVSGSSSTLRDKNHILFMYYPSTNAYKAYIKDGNNNKWYVVNLKQHATLNGAVWFREFDGELTEVQSDDVPALTTGNTVDLPNKIYTSEVNNPFKFPIINTVGTGTILGISSAVKALSQGQFGQFPLYAFTNEGVWALELSDTGTFKARQPVARDVVIGDGNSITQIDTAVLFATKRGIMLISGSNTSCISDTINSDSPFNINALYGLNGKGSSHDRFLDYINNCQMLYDYTHQRIIVYNPDKTYAYIYSLKSKMWSTMPSSIKDSLNSYPDALAQIQIVVPPAQEGDDPTTANKIINYSEDNPSVTTGFNGVLVTRPLKLDAPDLLKTVDTIIQRGHFRKGHVKSILYGSRDLFNWHPVYTSVDHYLRGFRGTPYKYFRIALLCTLDKDESIFGCTVQYTPRLIDQPR